MLSFIHTDLLTFHAEPSLDAVSALRLFFQPDAVPQSPTRQNKFVLKGSSSFHEWTSLTEFESTQMAHFRRMYASLRKRSDAGVRVDLGLHSTHCSLCWTPTGPRIKRRSRSRRTGLLYLSLVYGKLFALSCRALSSLVWQTGRRTGARYACGENGSRSGHPPTQLIGPLQFGLGLDIPSSLCLRG